MQIRAILELTRWKEHTLYVVPLSLIGILLGAADMQVPVDWKVIPLIFANLLANSFAFMFNDIEDAPDDARDPKKIDRNPISAGRLSRKEGIKAAKIVLTASALLYVLSGFLPFVTGAITLVLSHFYSWKKFRLKSMPLVDIISHVLMLGTLLVYSGFTVYSDNLSAIWLVGMTVALFSTYGQLFNQYRDLEADKKAGLNNTASLMSKKVLVRLMYSAAVIAAVTLIVAIYKGLFPFWLVVPFIIGVIVTYFLKKSWNEKAVIPLNVVAISWLVYELVRELHPF